MTKPRPAENKNVLIVEDHPLFRDMLVHLVEEQLGAKVCGQADNIEDAMSLIEKKNPDAALVDINLRGPGGLELIKDLITRNAELPVLVISMHQESLYAERALRAGAKGYISKEESPAEVVTAIRTVLDGRVYVSRRFSEAVLERSVFGSNPATGIDLLSDREIEVFQLVGQGLTTTEISDRIDLATSTVDTYRTRIKQKLGIHNTAELYQRAAYWLTETKA